MKMDKSKALAAWERIKTFLNEDCLGVRWSTAEAHIKSDLEAVEQALTAQPKAGDVEEIRRLTLDFMTGKMKDSVRKDFVVNDVNCVVDYLASHGYIVPCQKCASMENEMRKFIERESAAKEP